MSDPITIFSHPPSKIRPEPKNLVRYWVGFIPTGPDRTDFLKRNSSRPLPDGRPLTEAPRFLQEAVAEAKELSRKTGRLLACQWWMYDFHFPDGKLEDWKEGLAALKQAHQCLEDRTRHYADVLAYRGRGRAQPIEPRRLANARYVERELAALHEVPHLRTLNSGYLTTPSNTIFDIVWQHHPYHPKNLKSDDSRQ